MRYLVVAERIVKSMRGLASASLLTCAADGVKLLAGGNNNI